MRTTLGILLIVIGVLTSVVVPPNETVAIAKAKSYPHNLAVIHVARPDGMKTFPFEVVPQP
jgi:hypothetical protein